VAVTVYICAHARAAVHLQVRFWLPSGRGWVMCVGVVICLWRWSCMWSCSWVCASVVQAWLAMHGPSGGYLGGPFLSACNKWCTHRLVIQHRRPPHCPTGHQIGVCQHTTALACRLPCTPLLFGVCLPDQLWGALCSSGRCAAQRGGWAKSIDI